MSTMTRPLTQPSSSCTTSSPLSSSWAWSGSHSFSSTWQRSAPLAPCHVGLRRLWQIYGVVEEKEENFPTWEDSLWNMFIYFTTSNYPDMSMALYHGAS